MDSAIALGLSIRTFVGIPATVLLFSVAAFVGGFLFYKKPLKTASFICAGVSFVPAVGMALLYLHLVLRGLPDSFYSPEFIQ